MLNYVKNGRTVTLPMSSQATAKDNLRVLYLAVDAMRLNEKRGLGGVIQEAYLQLAGPEPTADPYELRTYAVARLCANVACSKSRSSVLGPARNCWIAGRIIASLVSNQLVPLVMR